MKNLRIWYFVS